MPHHEGRKEGKRESMDQGHRDRLLFLIDLPWDVLGWGGGLHDLELGPCIVIGSHHSDQDIGWNVLHIFDVFPFKRGVRAGFLGVDRHLLLHFVPQEEKSPGDRLPHHLYRHLGGRFIDLDLHLAFPRRLHLSPSKRPSDHLIGRPLRRSLG